MTSPSVSLHERLESLGRELGERESSHREAFDGARKRAEALHDQVARGLAAFHAAVRGAGFPELEIELSEVRVDDKHLRSIQFDLRRGRHMAIVTVKSRGEVTLVGPFRSGKVEGPCKSFPFAAEAELGKGLVDFLESFLEEAAQS